ncbi:MAG: hypothetical protein WCC10_08815 [Tumebacillaceae bacterium]
MPHFSFRYLLYMLLYTLFWLALAVIGYRTFFMESAVLLTAGSYCIWVGLLLVVCGGFRSMRTRQQRPDYRDPITGSLALSGLLLILYANFA